MSGYLQRLVQTAAKPAQTVHPFAGSVFAAPHEDESRAFESESVIAASPRAAPAVATSQPQNAPEHNLSRRTAPASEYRPIAPVSAAISLPSEGDADTLPSWSEESVQRSRPAADVESTGTEQPRTPASQREFRPLLPHEAVSAENLAAYLPLRSEIPHHNGRSPTFERGSDDIQIHIGRIEVTAVPPPAPRVPKSPDRTPRLDAYLNRSAR